MNQPPNPISASLLAEQGQAMRQLARRLVGNVDDAEDVAHDAVVIAIERGRGAERPRAWLMGVVRKLALKRRDADRRHERHARLLAVAPCTPAADVVAETLELQALVAALVAELGEPYRSAIHMRYFLGLAPRTIAANLGVSVHTVKTRLSRGLERLRGLLDTRHGGNRDAWRVAMAPLAGFSSAVGEGLTKAGVLASSLPSKLGLALSCAMLLACACWIGAGLLDSDPGARVAVGSSVGLVEPPSQAIDAADSRPSLRSRSGEASGKAFGVENAAVPEAGTSVARAPKAAGAPPAQRQVVLVGEIRGPEGRLLADIRVEFYANRYRDPRASGLRTTVRSSPSGVFRATVSVEVRGGPTHLVVVARSEAYGFVAAEVELDARVVVAPSVGLQFRDPCQVHVLACDEEGRALEGVECEACFRSGVVFRDPSGERVTSSTNSAGRALLRLSRVVPVNRFSLSQAGGFRIRVHKIGYAASFSPPIRLEDNDGDALRLELRRARTLECLFRFPDGSPVARRRFRLLIRENEPASQSLPMRPRVITTNADGRFSLPGVPSVALTLQCSSDGLACDPISVRADDRMVSVNAKRRFEARFTYADEWSGARLTAQFASVRREERGPLKPRAPNRSSPYPVRYGEQGGILVLGLAPGSYQAGVRFLGQAGMFRHRFVVADDDVSRSDIMVPAPVGRDVRISVNDASGEAFAGLTCHVGLAASLDLNRTPPLSIATSVQSRTDSAGVAMVRGLAAGNYAVLVLLGLGHQHRTSIDVDAAQGSAISVTVIVQGVASLRLARPREFGEAQVEFRPQVVGAGGSRHFPRNRSPGMDSPIRLDELPPGRVVVVPESPAFETRAFPGDPFAVAADLAVGEAATPRWPPLHLTAVKIVVRESDGGPARGRRLLLLRVGPAATARDALRHSYRGGKVLALDAEGSVPSAWLLPGRYFATLAGPGSSSHEFEVSEDERQVIQIRR